VVSARARPTQLSNKPKQQADAEKERDSPGGGGTAPSAYCPPNPAADRALAVRSALVVVTAEYIPGWLCLELELGLELELEVEVGLG
jgi:hypothetical protein